MKENGSYYYYRNDHLGTPVQITDADGLVVWEARYDSFGKAVDIWGQNMNSDPDITSNLRFPGQYYDSETGLHYNWHRYYDPSTGRYLRTDPLGLEGGLNLYQYANANPVNFVDPMGLLSFGGGGSVFIGLWGSFGDISYVSCCEDDGRMHHYTVSTVATGLGLGAGSAASVSPFLGANNKCPVKEGTEKYVCGMFAMALGASGCVPADNSIFDFSGASLNIVGGKGGYIGSFKVKTKILNEAIGEQCCN